ncbi:GntR family transcriptional regulator, partial [Streptomyces sp. NPDC059456]|uniref:GntR family transcriptional regulator n=1 Tax=Streptomyces sp. NPDC059456 TaxID=3346838 RepID=UPI003694905E
MDSAEPDRSKGSKTRGSDFLQLDPAQAPPGRRTDWLTARIRAAIADGTLPVGSRLPPGRVLAAELGVTRGLVTEAYRRLADAGQVAGRGRAGTIVLAAPIPPAPAPPRAPSTPPGAPPAPGGPFAPAASTAPTAPADPLAAVPLAPAPAATPSAAPAPGAPALSGGPFAPAGGGGRAAPRGRGRGARGGRPPPPGRGRWRG